MKCAVVAVTDGNFNIHTEHSDINAAIVEWHGYCKALWNDQNTTDAMVAIMDENLDVVGKYKEFIHHEG